MDWTLAQVEAHLVEAAWTFVRLPGGDGRPKDAGSGWPEYMRERGVDYADATLDEAARSLSLRCPPSAREVDRMTVILDWLLFIESPMDRSLVLCAAISRGGHAREWKYDGNLPATKMNWDRVRMLIRRLTSKVYQGGDRSTQTKYRNALVSIAGKLNAGAGGSAMLCMAS